MQTNEQLEATEALNERSLNTLIRAITLAQGQFALILVRCNYLRVRDRMMDRLRERCTISVWEMTLPESARTLYTMIQQELANEATDGVDVVTDGFAPQSLMVFGLEAVRAIDQVLVATNVVREEFRKHLPFPIVLWVNDRVLYKLDRLAPDLKSWTGNALIEFQMAIPDLVRSLRNHTERLFTDVLDAGDLRFAPSWTIAPSANALRQAELEFALNDLHNSDYILEQDLQANLDFLLGQDAHSQNELETARECYERSLAFWQVEAEQQQATLQVTPSALIPHPSPLEREACIVFYLGIWWRSYSVLQHSAYINACQMARDFFQASLQLFEEAHRQDLVAKFISALAEVLQKLEEWETLEQVAKRALVLHQLYPDLIRQARDRGFLAEVALARRSWAEAKQQMEAGLHLLEQVAATLANPASQSPQEHSRLEQSLEVAHRYHYGWYLLLLAKAETELGQVDVAIAHLENARAHVYPKDDPQLYIRILRVLHQLYFEKKYYLEAFRTKQTRHSIEQQYGLRAFVGALRVEPQRHLLNPLLDRVNPEELLAQEIRASGRRRDVERLLVRMTRNDYKLTVIHGPSGVGKSSIINAGLTPELRDRVIGDRTTLPIVLDVYTDWLANLHRSLMQAMADHAPTQPDPPQPTTAVVLSQLRQATDRNRLVVLIFDQFEEFFFVYRDLLERRPFYHFLRDCLNLPFIKVILSLREDYLHYLLELQRLTNLDIIDNDILGREIRYPLGDFSIEDTKSVIQELTNQAKFYLDNDLVDELVRDLAGDLGEVRPIELQVVGAQLQAENITTLAQYHKKGPKEKLVQRSLESVVRDCGCEHQQLAWTVLFLLTNENNNRPSKTLDELETDLANLKFTATPEQLNLVLEVLTGSGLVFKVLETPADRYQLVHDYLVSYIRQQHGSEIDQLKVELEQEREQRQLAEEKYNTVLQQMILLQQQQLKTERQKRATLKQLLNLKLGREIFTSVVLSALGIALLFVAPLTMAIVSVVALVIGLLVQKFVNQWLQNEEHIHPKSGPIG